MKKISGFLLSFKINKIIQVLIYSDFLVISGWGLIGPIMAVFFTNQIKGGTVAVAGLASTVYFLTKSILQVPVARYIDTKKGEWDDFWVMCCGFLIISLVAFLFSFASLPWHIYAIQIFHGIGGAFCYPAWMAIFTRHVDKLQEGSEWSLYYTTVDFGSALSAGLGGLLVEQFGYQTMFLLVGLTSLAGTFFLAAIARDMKGREGLQASYSEL